MGRSSAQCRGLCNACPAARTDHGARAVLGDSSLAKGIRSLPDRRLIARRRDASDEPNHDVRPCEVGVERLVGPIRCDANILLFVRSIACQRMSIPAYCAVRNGGTCRTEIVVDGGLTAQG